MCPLPCPGLFTSIWKLGSNQPEGCPSLSVSVREPNISCLSQAKAVGWCPSRHECYSPGTSTWGQGLQGLCSWRQLQKPDARKHCGQDPQGGDSFGFEPREFQPWLQGPPAQSLLSQGPKPSVGCSSFSLPPPLTSSTFFLLDLSLGAQVREAPFRSTVNSGMESLEGCLCGEGEKG